MTQFQSRTVAFIGLGLISGSLARALRASSWNGTLTAWGPREASLQRGLDVPFVNVTRYRFVVMDCLTVMMR